MIKEKYRVIILQIVRIKINIFFIIIFMGGVLYCADRFAEAIAIREIFFWVSIMLILIMNSFNPFSTILNMTEEYVVSKKVRNSESKRSGEKK